MDQTTELINLASADEMIERVTVVSVERKGDRVTQNTHEHEIRPFTFHQFFKVLPHFDKILKGLQVESLDLDVVDKDPVELVKLIVHVFAVAADSVEALIALAINRPVEYFNTLDPNDGIKLAVAVFKVNKSFFVERMLPTLEMFKPAATETAIATPGATS